MSSFTSSLPNCRPVKHLKAKTVFCKFTAACCSRKVNKTLTVFGERNDGGCCLCAFQVLDHDTRSLILHDGGARDGRTQVNTYKTSGVHVRGHVA